MKIKKKLGEGVESGGGGRGEGQCGCERRIEVFVKIQKKIRGRGGGVKVRPGMEGGGGPRGGGWLVAMLGVGGNVGYGGCEPRIEGIVQCTKWYCTILRKLKNVDGGGVGAIFEPKTLSMYLKKKKKKKSKNK